MTIDTTIDTMDTPDLQSALLLEALQQIERLQRTIAELLLKNERLRQRAESNAPPATR